MYHCYYTIERGPTYLWEQRSKVSYTFLHFSLLPGGAIAVMTREMFWLDGSSTLPFPIVSTSFLGEACVEYLTKSVENQAKIAKSWVEIGNFNHWCHAASELVDLTNHLVYMEKSLLYYEGLISKNERLRHCSKLNSQLVDLVSFSMFERACERLLANFKSVPHLEPSITTLSPLRDQLVNRRPSLGSAETGTQ